MEAPPVEPAAPPPPAVPALTIVVDPGHGGVETGAEHYPLIVGLHAAWLAGLWWLAWDRPASLPWLAVYVVLQGLRIWILASLGRRWTTRVMVRPGAMLRATS